MKAIVQLTVAAGLVASAAASAHQAHQHLHRHAKKNAGDRQLENRDVYTSVCEGPTVTAYVYADGGVAGEQEAQDCIKEGKCLVVGSTVPTFTPPPAPSSTAKLADQAAQFVEQKTSQSKPTPTPASTGYSTGGATGINAPFPDGELDCGEVPTQYGAIKLPWLGLNGWASVQQCAWTVGTALSNIVQPVSGTCDDGSFCSYACQTGYTKTQWPSDQGATGQSVGGLRCTNGKLYLTNKAHQTLCMPGAGGVTIQSELSQEACVCQTNYPGDEKMSIPLVTSPGGTYTLMNPDAKTSYKWQGKFTSAQYYVNPAGVSVDQACVWTSPDYPTQAGNWSPLNIGTGKAIDGTTYISIFPNLPTSHAKLNFDIEITGDTSAKCAYSATSNSFTGGGNGCTVSAFSLLPSTCSFI